MRPGFGFGFFVILMITEQKEWLYCKQLIYHNFVICIFEFLLLKYAKLLPCTDGNLWLCNNVGRHFDILNLKD